MDRVARTLAQIRDQPLHRFLGIGEIEAGHGHAQFDMTVTANSANPFGALHGGVVYTLCDVVCFAALLHQLGDDEHAVTHDIHASVMRAARIGETVRFSGRVARRGRSLAFIDAFMHRGEDLIASARLTKSIVAAG